jgi:hypothetical protein
MDLKVDRRSLMSMNEVERHQWTGVDIHGPTDIDVDILMAIYLHVPHPEVYDGGVANE